MKCSYSNFHFEEVETKLKDVQNLPEVTQLIVAKQGLHLNLPKSISFLFYGMFIV